MRLVPYFPTFRALVRHTVGIAANVIPFYPWSERPFVTGHLLQGGQTPPLRKGARVLISLTEHTGLTPGLIG